MNERTVLLGKQLSVDDRSRVAKRIMCPRCIGWLYRGAYDRVRECKRCGGLALRSIETIDASNYL